MSEFVNRLLRDPATMRKFLVVFGAAVAAVVAQGLLNNEWEAWANAIIMFLSAIGVYKVPNAPDNTSTKSRIASVMRGDYGYTELTLILLVAAVVLVILCLVGVL